MLPLPSSCRPCGPELAVSSGNSCIAPVTGSTRPSLLANWPVHQIEPSAAGKGSWGREPSVGAIHSLILTFTGPEISVGSVPGFLGKCSARYSTTESLVSPGSVIIVLISASQSSCVYPLEFGIKSSRWQAAHVPSTMVFASPSGSWTAGRSR